jgi:hypothetical protein
MTIDFERRALIVRRDVSEYDGTTAVTRSTHLSPDRIEFLRWKAERWLKLRHMRSAFWHDPVFVATHAWQMLTHTFRGTTWRSLLGLESPEEVFRRYRALRVREREYLDVADPLGVTETPLVDAIAARA